MDVPWALPRAPPSRDPQAPYQRFSWSGRRDLNPRPQRPERCALTKLRYFPVRSMVVDHPPRRASAIGRPRPFASQTLTGEPISVCPDSVVSEKP